MQDVRVESPGQKDPLEEEMAIHSSILAWEIHWTQELQFMQLQGVELDLATQQQ